MQAIPRLPLALFAVATCALLALAAKPQDAKAQDANAQQAWKYKIVIDISEKEANELAEEGWEYGGYLGESKLGTGSDESIWRQKK